MPHREILADMEAELRAHKHFYHQGVFRIDEVRRLVERWAQDHSYYLELKDNKETVKEHARDLDRHVQLQKRISSVHHSVLEVNLEFRHVTESVETIDSVRERLDSGEAKVAIFGFIMTSAKHRFEGRPAMRFLRDMLDKYIYKINRGKEVALVAHDAAELCGELKSLFLLYDRRSGKKKKGHDAHH